MSLPTNETVTPHSTLTHSTLPHTPILRVSSDPGNPEVCHGGPRQGKGSSVNPAAAAFNSPLTNQNGRSAEVPGESEAERKEREAAEAKRIREEMERLLKEAFLHFSDALKVTDIYGWISYYLTHV